MWKRHLRLWVLIGVVLALAAVAIWRLATGGRGSLVGLGPEAARIERYRRKGDVAGLARKAGNSRGEVARRAVEAMGYVGPKSVPHIKRAMQDNRVEVREKAAIALGRAARRDQAGLLANAAVEDRSATVRAAAVTALGQMYAYNQMETLLAALDDKDRMVRRRAGAAITRITGIDFGFRADAPPQERRETVARIRALWPGMERDVRDYYTARPNQYER